MMMNLLTIDATTVYCSHFSQRHSEAGRRMCHARFTPWIKVRSDHFMRSGLMSVFFSCSFRYSSREHQRGELRWSIDAQEPVVDYRVLHTVESTISLVAS